MGKFRRLRQMVAIEFAELRRRERDAAERVRRQQARDEEERRARQLAARKMKAQGLLDEFDEFFSDVRNAMPKAEAEAKPILTEQRLVASEMQDVATKTEAAAKLVSAPLTTARERLEEAMKVLSTDLAHLLKAEISVRQSKLGSEEERFAKLQSATKNASEKAAKKEVEEVKAAKQKKVFSKLERAYQEQDGSDSDAEFDF